MSISVVKRRHRNLVSSFLTDDGTVTGNFNFVGDYAVTPAQPFFAVPPGIVIELTSFQIIVGAGGKLAQTGYGDLAALSNGVDIRAVINGVDTDLSIFNIKNNNDLFGFGAGNSQILEYAANQDTISSCLNLIPAFGEATVILNGNVGDNIYVNLTDNFTGLNEQKFVVRGMI